MHRKRVTCELTAWQLFPLDDDQTCHSKDIVWAIELLYNSVKTGSQWVWRPVGEKMLGWEHVPERLGPQASGWAVQENENDTRLCPEGLGRSICCSSVRSPTPSHSKTLSNPFRTLSIKWEVDIFLKDCVACYHCVVVFYMNLHMTIQHIPNTLTIMPIVSSHLNQIYSKYKPALILSLSLSLLLSLALSLSPCFSPSLSFSLSLVVTFVYNRCDDSLTFFQLCKVIYKSKTFSNLL